MPEVLYAEQPIDLIDQVLRLAHSHTARLPYSEQEDFRQEVLFEVFSKWPMYRPPPDGAKLSVWVMHRVLKVWKNTTRVIMRQMSRYVSTDFGYEGQEGPDTNVSAESYVYQKSTGVYSHDPEVERKIDFDRATVRELMLDEVQDFVSFNSDEEFVADLKMNGWPLKKIAAETDMTHLEVRRAASSVRKKLKAAHAMMTSSPPDIAINNQIVEHAKLRKPFPETPFAVVVRRLGTERVLRGIDGVRTAVSLANGAAAVNQPCEVSILFDSDKLVAGTFWTKYRRIIRKCSNLSVSVNPDGIEICGDLNRQESGADVVWGVIMAENCIRAKRIRSSAPFVPNAQDFSMMVQNLRGQNLADGPAFDGAVESWRGRIHG